MIIEPITVVIEHPSNKGTGRMLLRNAGTADVPLEISIGDFSSTLASNGKAPLGAKATIAWVDAAGKALAAAPTSLAPRKLTYAAIEVADVWESGLSVATIYNQGQKIGELSTLKYKLPLAVKLDVATPDKPEIGFERGQKTQILLKNDDPLTYLVITQLMVGNETLAETKQAVITPNGLLRVEVSPPDAWFRRSLSQIFKPEPQPARLLLSVAQQAGGVQWPVKSLSFQANLSYYSQGFRDVFSIVVLFVVLLAGGVTSVALNNAIPNAFAQIDLKGRLVAAGRNERGLSTLIDSRIRGTLATEQARLRELLASRAVFSPDFQTIAGEARLHLNLLETRLQLLARLDSLSHSLQAQSSEQPLPAPTRVAAAETRLRALADRVAFTIPLDQDLKDLKNAAFVKDNAKAIDDLEITIGNLRAPDDPFATALDRRTLRAKGRLAALLNNGTLLGFQNALPALFNALGQIPPGPPTPEDYTAVDTTVTKLEWIFEFVDASATTSFSGERLQPIKDEFVARLGPQAWEELKRAREYLLQFSQGVMPSDIADAIRSDAGTLGIEGPISLQPERPATYRVRFFGRDDLMLCSARDEVKCFWDFGDGLKAQGWEVNHFYQRARTMQPLSRYVLGQRNTIRVTFADEKGHAIRKEGSDEPREILRAVKVKTGLVGLGTRTRLEAVWLLASLAIPFLGLISGARQDFLKADAATGVVVIFLLGFGANHVKDLFKRA